MSISDHQSNYVDDVLARLDAALTDVAELGLSSLPIDDLNRVVVRTCALVSQAQGLQATAIQEAEHAAMSVRYGNRILTTHLAKETGQPTRTLGSARTLAMWLCDFPELGAAFTKGTISRAHLDALLRLMARGWRRNDGTYPDFLINIVMSEKVAEDLLARTYGHTDPNGTNPLNIDPFELPISWDDIDSRCETIRGTPIHPNHALGVLLAGKLRRMILDANNAVVNHGEDTRFFTKHQRNALLVQQRGQCNLGTQTPFRWLEADHIQPTSKGGPTNLKNGQMINSAENKAKRDTSNPNAD